MAAIASGFCATHVIASITSCKQCGGQLSKQDPNYLSTNSEHDTFQVYSPIKEATMRQDKTVQYQPICDTYSAISTHMRHVQCNINPYATRTVQYQPICDTYSAAPLYMRHVQCTDTDPCHMRHVYAGCMVVNSLMTFRMSKLLTLCLAAVSMARFCYATLHSLPQASFRFTFISRGSKLAV